jgi:MoaA/NifB/PqqE/SkfB family radical SAM enzyme
MSYTGNLLKLALGKRLLDPLVAIYYVTTQCNLHCAYCEDFGAPKNAQNQPPAPLEDARHILSVIRSGVSALWITGGEPLLVPHLPELLEYAQRELKFRQISLITNGILLPSRTEILPYLNRLIISLDSLSPTAWDALNMPATYAQNILPAVIQAASLQKQHKFRLILNAVITPESLQNPNHLTDLLAFCTEHKTTISFSPQSTNNWTRYDLLTHPGYREFIHSLLAHKKRGAPILGSDQYLRTLLKNAPYDCYPTLAPRILPNGDLTYPCRPIEKAGGEHGGRAVNLRSVSNWKTAIQIAHANYGDPPGMCSSCYQQCYAEPSLMQTNPLHALHEDRDLFTFTPG